MIAGILACVTVLALLQMGLHWLMIRLFIKSIERYQLSIDGVAQFLEQARLDRQTQHEENVQAISKQTEALSEMNRRQAKMHACLREDESSAPTDDLGGKSTTDFAHGGN